MNFCWLYQVFCDELWKQTKISWSIFHDLNLYLSDVVELIALMWNELVELKIVIQSNSLKLLMLLEFSLRHVLNFDYCFIWIWIHNVFVIICLQQISALSRKQDIVSNKNSLIVFSVFQFLQLSEFFDFSNKISDEILFTIKCLQM